MKKIIFSILLLILTSIIFVATLSQQDVKQIEDPLEKIGISFTPSSETLALSASGSTIPLKATDTSSTRIRMLDVSDHILFLQSNENDIQVEKTGVSTSIQIGEGIFYFFLNNPLISYTIHAKEASITLSEKGGFFIDTRNSELRIYSISAILKTQILENSSAITTFDIFPSMLLIHSSEFNKELAGADIFRVAQIDTLRSVDMLSPLGSKVILGTDAEQFSSLLESEQLFLRKHNSTLVTFFSEIPLQAKTLDANIFEEYGIFFFNTEKRRILLRNSLVRSLIQFGKLEMGICMRECTNEKTEKVLIGDIKTLLWKLGDISPESKKEGDELIQKYISLFASNSEKKDVSYAKTGFSGISQLTAVVMGPNELKKHPYSILSELFHSYFILKELQREELDKELNISILSLLDRHGIEQKDFVSFLFFLKEYLSSSWSDSQVSLDTITLFKSTFSIAHYYTETLKKDDEKFSALSVIFFALNTSIGQLNEKLKNQFFSIASPRLIIKPNYWLNWKSKAPPLFLDGIAGLMASINDFSKTYGEFYTNTFANTPSNINNFSIFEGTYWTLKLTISAITNYDDYVKDLDESWATATQEESTGATAIESSTGASDTVPQWDSSPITTTPETPSTASWTIPETSSPSNPEEMPTLPN